MSLEYVCVGPNWPLQRQVVQVGEMSRITLGEPASRSNSATRLCERPACSRSGSRHAAAGEDASVVADEVVPDEPQPMPSRPSSTAISTSRTLRITVHSRFGAEARG